MKSFVILMCLLLSFSSWSLHAEAMIDPKTQTFLDKMTKAQGGEKVIKAVKSIESKMVMSMPGAGVKIDMLVQIEMHKARLVSEMQGQVMSLQVYDGKKAWSKDPINGTIELKGEMKASIVSSTLHASYHMEKFYDEIVVEEGKKLDGKDAYYVVCKKKGMPDKTFVVDLKTHLPLAYKAKEVTPNGTFEVTAKLSDYVKSKSGVLYPKTLSMEMGPMKMVAKTVEYKENVEFDANLFKKP